MDDTITLVQPERPRVIGNVHYQAQTVFHRFFGAVGMLIRALSNSLNVSEEITTETLSQPVATLLSSILGWILSLLFPVAFMNSSNSPHTQTFPDREVVAITILHACWLGAQICEHTLTTDAGRADDFILRQIDEELKAHCSKLVQHREKVDRVKEFLSECNGFPRKKAEWEKIKDQIPALRIRDAERKYREQDRKDWEEEDAEIRSRIPTRETQEERDMRCKEYCDDEAEKRKPRWADLVKKIEREMKVWDECVVQTAREGCLAFLSLIPDFQMLT